MDLKIKMDLKNKILNKQNRFENKIQIINIMHKVANENQRKQKENQYKKQIKIKANIIKMHFISDFA